MTEDRKVDQEAVPEGAASTKESTKGATVSSIAGRARRGVAAPPATVAPKVEKAHGAGTRAAGGRRRAAEAPVDALPPLPRMRKPKKPLECECGCGAMTKGGRFIPGHDSRLKGWALRVERDLIKLKDIPDEGTRKAVAKMLRAGRRDGTTD